MNDFCKTEGPGTPIQSWEWSEVKPAGSPSWEKKDGATQGLSWIAPISGGGDSLWRNPVRTCLPELFTVARLGTIKVTEEYSKHIWTQWKEQDVGIFDKPLLQASLPTEDSGGFYSHLDFLNSIKGVLTAGQFKESITLWSLFWIFLNAQAKIIDSTGLVLYTYNKDSGKVTELFKFNSEKGCVDRGKFQEDLSFKLKPAFVEWMKTWDRVVILAKPGPLDKINFDELIAFTSVMNRKESGMISEYIIFFGGYGIGSGYGLGEYGR